MSARKRRSSRTPGRTPTRKPDPTAAAAAPSRWEGIAARAGGPLWLVATAALLWSLMFRFLLNSDIWFHLAAGRLIWERRSIPATDSWSFTAAGRPWHNHEWLSDLVYHGWTRVFGVDGLVWWQWLVEGCAYLLLYRLLARLSGARAAAALLAVLALAVGSPFFDIRPNLWSVLAFVGLIATTLGRERPPVVLPLLFVVWANLHGGVMLGVLALPILLGAPIVASIGDGTPVAPRIARAAGWWAAAVAATCVNPWGWRVFSFAIGLASSADMVSRTTLFEWLPPWVPGGIESPLFPWAVGLGAVAAIALLPRVLRAPRDGEAIAALGLTLLTLAMALQSRRFIPYFAIAQAVLAARAVGALVRGELRRPRAAAPAAPRPRHAVASAAVALLALAAGAWRLRAYPLDARAFDPLSWASQMPVESLNFLDANGIGGKLFAYHLWGGYVEYRAPGRLLVHVDPRAETVFDAATQRTHFAVLEGRPGWEETLDGTGAELVLWPMLDERQRAQGRELAASPRWRTLYRDGVSLLLARRDLALPPEPWRETPDSGYRSWARGRQAMDGRRYPEAVVALERALDQQPRLWPACHSLAVAQVMLDDRRAVEATVERCRRIFPFPYFTAEKLLAGRE